MSRTQENIELTRVVDRAEKRGEDQYKDKEIEVQLGQMIQSADPINVMKIKNTWPEYKKVAERDGL